MRLVTIASFDTIPQAHLARNELESAGIRAVITDEETTGMFWHLANALGGAKVQVTDEDAERAVAILEERFGEDESEPDEAPSLEEQALAEQREEGERDSRDPLVVSPGESVDGGEPNNAEREEQARRLFFVAWIGMAFPPLAFYAFYLMLNAAFGIGKLSPVAGSTC